jgi:chromosomal replication initiator protein
VTAGLAHLLESAREDIERGLGRHRFRLWFRDVSVESVSGRHVTLGVPTEVHRTWLQYNWSSLLSSAFERVLGEGVTVSLEVSPRLAGRREIRDRMPADEAAWAELVAERVPGPTFASFVGDEQGRFAVAFLSHLVHGNADAQPTAVYLCGEAGTGKTHLLGALHRELEARAPGSSVLWTAREFASRFANTLRAREAKAVAGFRAATEGRRFLLLDDLDALAGKPATQHELDRLLDRAAGRGFRFVGAGRASPRDLPDLSDRLRSRLLGGVVHRLAVPDAARRLAILKTRAASVPAPVPDETLRALLDHAPSFPAAVAWLDRTAAVAARDGAPVPPDGLDDTVPPREARTAREEVVRRAKELVARQYGIRAALLDRPGKNPGTVLPRRIAMYLAYRAAAMPLSELGKAFGLRSHTSAARALRDVRERRDADPTVEVVVDGLLAQI